MLWFMRKRFVGSYWFLFAYHVVSSVVTVPLPLRQLGVAAMP